MGYSNNNKTIIQIGNEIISQLLKGKVGNGTKAKMEDLHDDVINAMTGGGTVNVLSIPQDGSVTPKKTDFLKMEYSKNLFDKSKVILDMFDSSPLAGYWSLPKTAEGMIEVKAGDVITAKPVRLYTLYDEKLISYDNKNTGSNTATATFTVAKDGYLFLAGRRETLDTTQVEYGTTATEPMPYGSKVTFPKLEFNAAQMQLIKDTGAGQVKEATALMIKKTGDYYEVSSLMEDGSTIAINLTRSGSKNGSFNFENVYINGTLFHSPTDDVTPIRAQGTTLGGNHGFTSISVIPLPGHGKSISDVGSKWTDGVTEYTLLKVEGDVLTFARAPKDENGIVSTQNSPPVGDFVHVSGATNTATVSIATRTAGQLYPSTNKIKVKFLLDGKDITKDGVHYGNELVVTESYNIMDYKSIIDYAQANIGKPYYNTDIKGFVRMGNVFTFTKGGKCFTSHTMEILQDVTLGECGFLQSAIISARSGYTRKRYMPYIKALNGLDFAAGVNMENFNTSQVVGINDLIDPAIPPSHYYDWLHDAQGEKTFGYSMGYVIDKTDSTHEERLKLSIRYWDLRSTGKSYPVAIANKVARAGEFYHYQGFRNYISAVEAPLNNVNIVKDRSAVYVYADAIADAGRFRKELPQEIGRPVSVIQDTGLELINDVVNAEGVLFNANGISSAIVKIQ